MDNDYATVYRTLDRGAQGIVVPHVNNRAEAEAVVAAGKFAPLGKRGMYTSPPGLRRRRLSEDRQRPELADRPDRGHRRGPEPRRDPQGRSHRLLLRGAERPGDLDGPDREHGASGRPADHRTARSRRSSSPAGSPARSSTSATSKRYTRLGVRVVMTSFFPWIQAGAKELIERAAAGAGADADPG